MLNHLQIEAETLYCLGDIHGEYGGIGGWLKRYDLQNACLVFCGDIGLGFNSEAYYQQVFSKLNRECKKRNVTLIFLRGNHDDPSYFAEQKIHLSHIHAVPDYTLLSVAGHEVLCVGGAVSIDRMLRQAKMLQLAVNYACYHRCSITEARENAPKGYWAYEMPIYDAGMLDEIRDSGVKIDVVCTHTAPSFAEPHTKEGIAEWLKQDEHLAEDIQIERETLDQLWERLKADRHPLKTWCYGHYHYHHAEVHEGVIFRLLDMCRHNCIYDMVEVRFT